MAHDCLDMFPAQNMSRQSHQEFSVPIDDVIPTKIYEVKLFHCTTYGWILPTYNRVLHTFTHFSFFVDKVVTAKLGAVSASFQKEELSTFARPSPIAPIAGLFTHHTIHTFPPSTRRGVTIYEEDWTALLADPIYVSNIYTHMCMCIRTYSCLAAHVSLRLRLSDISDRPTQHYPSQQLQLRLKIPFCRSKEPSSCSYTVSVLECCTYKLPYKPV